MRYFIPSLSQSLQSSLDIFSPELKGWDGEKNEAFHNLQEGTVRDPLHYIHKSMRLDTAGATEGAEAIAHQATFHSVSAVLAKQKGAS